MEQVGSIVNTQTSRVVKKMDEKGYFKERLINGFGCAEMSG
jgi:hypothetical protein